MIITLRCVFWKNKKKGEDSTSMLLVTQHSHVKYVILCSVVGNRKKFLGSTPSTCLSNCYSSFFQHTFIYFPRVAYYAICTKLGSDWLITTFLVDSCF